MDGSTSAADPVPPMPERTVGPYRILSEVGRGGMGVVYKAFDPSLRRTIALKVLVMGEDAPENALARFRREASAVARLGHHPHIVPVYDVGSEGRVHYIAMHYVDGPSLDRLLDEGPLEPREAARIALAVARALDHAHGHGILHRDVKPANILLARSGEEPPNSRTPTSATESETSNPKSVSVPMLTDFGLAKDVQAETRVTRSGVALGTPQTMAPEQARGDLDAVDERTDVYGLGATLYEMLTQTPVFDGSSVAQILQQVVLCDPKPVRRANPAVDRDLETICLACLRKDPGRRYGSASALAKDLTRYLDGRPIAARPVPAHEKAWLFARRNRALTAVVAVLALLLAAGAGVLALGLRARAVTVREGSAARDEARDAEREKTAAETGLDAARAVSSLFREADRKLGGCLEALKASHHSPRSPEEKRSLGTERWGDVQAFESGLPSDRASKAAWLTAKGWLLHLAGRRQEAMDCFADSRRTDPRVPHGRLFEGMVWLSEYLERQPLPSVQSGPLGVSVGALAPETPELRLAWEGFETALASVDESGALGRAASADFRLVLEGLGAWRDRDWEGAERGLAAGLRAPEMVWLREEILFARSKARFVRKDFEGALRDIEDVIRGWPESAAARVYRGKFLEGSAHQEAAAGRDGRGLFREAIASFDAALGLDPESVMAWTDRSNAVLALAEAAGRRGEDPVAGMEEALKGYGEALERRPDCVAALRGRGSARTRLGVAVWNRGGNPDAFFQGALEDLEAVQRLAPEDDGVDTALGMLLREKGMVESQRGQDPRTWYRKAADTLGRRIRRAPGDALARVNRAWALRDLAGTEAEAGQDPEALFREAVEECDEALRRAPELTHALLCRGVCHASLGDGMRDRGGDPRPAYEAALADFGAALDRDAELVDAYSNRALVLLSLGQIEAGQGRDPTARVEAAVSDFSAAIARSPKNPVFLLNRALALQFLADLTADAGRDAGPVLERAIADLDRSLRSNPEFVPAYINRAVLLQDLARAEEAAGRDPEGALLRSVKDCDEALERNPKALQAHHARGMALLDLGAADARKGRDPSTRFGEALRCFEEVLRQNPRSWRTLATRGQTLERLGRFGEAAQCYARALDIVGDGVPALKSLLARATALASAPAWRRGIEEGAALLGSGRRKEARRVLEEALAQAGRDGAHEASENRPLLCAAHYNLACIHSLDASAAGGDASGALERSLAELRRAFALGWSDFAHARRDPDLETLRASPAFEALLGEFEGEGGR